LSTYADLTVGEPGALAVDNEGNVYVGMTNEIRKIDTNGNITTYTGSDGIQGSTDGVLADATFSGIGGLVFDSIGNLYVSDTENHTIRKIDTAGNVSTFAGTVGSFGSTDAQGTSAKFHFPIGLTVDSNDNIYVADMNNHTIRKIDTAANVSTFAGTTGSSGSVDAQGTSASFFSPYSLASDSSDNIYVGDKNNLKIRMIDTGANVTTIAGDGTYGSTDGIGENASFKNPSGLVVDSAGNIYVADSDNHTIRKISTDGNVSTVSGSGSMGSTDGDGLSASFGALEGMTIDLDGNLYVAGRSNSKIRKLAKVTKISGTPTNDDVGVYDINLSVSDGNGGVDTQNFELSVINVNDAPIASDITISMNKNTSKTFSANDFNFTDVDAGDELYSVTFMMPPMQGALTLNDVNVTFGQTILKDDIANLKFTPVANTFSTEMGGVLVPYTQMSFRLSDGDADSGMYFLNIFVNDAVDTPTPTTPPVNTGGTGSETTQETDPSQKVDSPADELETGMELDEAQESDEKIVIIYKNENGEADTEVEIPKLEGKTINIIYTAEAIELTTGDGVASYNNNGTVEHLMVVDNKETIAISYIPGAKVEFTATGGVQTSVTTQTKSKILIEATQEGYSVNSVETVDGKVSVADSTIIGTKTEIQENGNVVVDTPEVLSSKGNTITTKTTLDANGKAIVSAVKTLPDGTQESIDLGNYNEGSEVSVEEKDGAVLVKVKTKLGTEVFQLRNGRL